MAQPPWRWLSHRSSGVERGPAGWFAARPSGTEAVVRLGSWEVPPLFVWLERAGAVPREDMLRTFNMGVGLIVAVAPGDADMVIGELRAAGEKSARVIGRIAAAPEGQAPAVRYEG